MINLLSKDLEPINYVVLYVPLAIIGTVEVLVIALILWQMVAVEALSGLSFLLVIWIYQSRMKPLLKKLRQQTTVLTDKRLRTVSDVISGVRMLKSNAWEWLFKDVVGETRR